MQSKPTIVFSPGAWHTPDCFDKVRHVLEGNGYPTEAIGHPSIGAEPPTKSMEDDASHLRGTLLQLIEDEGRSVVLIGHSYGGAVISNASEGLGSLERAKQGKKGGISLLLFMTAFVLPKGTSVFDGLGGNWLPWMKFNGEYSHSSEEEDIFYHDVAGEDLQIALSRLSHSSRHVFFSQVSYEPWNHMQTGFLLCDDDRAIPLQLQEMLYSFLQKGSAENELPPAVKAHVPASHSPFLSMPERTAEAIEGMIDASGEKSICRDAHENSHL